MTAIMICFTLFSLLVAVLSCWSEISTERELRRRKMID